MAIVLVVDDSLIDRQLAGGLLRKDATLEIVYANNGQEALDAIARQTPDVIVTDMLMPEMDGLELISMVRQDHPAIPVVIMTAHGSEASAVQALRQGAASYVPKRNLATDLLRTVQDILTVAVQARDQQRVLDRLKEAKSYFMIENDPNVISPLIGFMQQCLVRRKLCDEIGIIRVAVALREALDNAMNHGNLEVSSTLREGDDSRFHRALHDRRQLEPYKSRRIHVHIHETPDEVYYSIRDEGPGFNPGTVPDPTEPANLEKVSGRGLLLIRTFMDHVAFNSTGNEITMIKRRDTAGG
jgi:CheY-like chemotaxis protein/anti-sigma regulatory factor (Ser/Thr protein kinase)